MNDTQLYLAIGVPVVMNAVMLTLAVTLLNGRIGALQSELHASIEAQDKLFSERLRRVEEVIDARLRLIEDKLGIGR